MELKLEVLREEVKQFRNKSNRVTKRLLALIALTKSRQKWGRTGEQDYERLALVFGVSGRSLYRWESAYRQGGAHILRPGKSTGRPVSAVRGHTAKKIRDWLALPATQQRSTDQLRPPTQKNR